MPMSEDQREEIEIMIDTRVQRVVDMLVAEGRIAPPPEVLPEPVKEPVVVKGPESQPPSQSEIAAGDVDPNIVVDDNQFGAMKPDEENPVTFAHPSNEDVPE